jgi:hypothetical protein
MSYQELAPEFNVQPLGALTKGNQADKEPDSIGQSAERLKLGGPGRDETCKLWLPLGRCKVIRAFRQTLMLPV